MIRSRRITANALPVTTTPPFGERANAASLFSSSPGSLTLTGTMSTPSAGPTEATAANCPAPDRIAGSRTTAARVTPVATCLSSSSHFPLVPYSNARKPVMLPPGRAMLSTKPRPTGSATIVNTIGTVRVACFSADTPLAAAKMTSGASPTNSSAYWRLRSTSPAAQRRSIRKLRPTAQPNCCRPCRNAARRAWLSGLSASPGMSTPIRRIRSPCCARAVSGHAAAAPPSSVMNCRLLTSNMELPPGLLPRGDEGVGSRSYAPTHTIAHHGYAGARCAAAFHSSECRGRVKLGLSAMSARCPVCLKADMTGRLMSLVWRADRQAHREHRTLARLARHRHVAAHHARKLARDGKAKPRSAELLRSRGIGLGEFFEQLCLLLRRHANASIRDGELEKAAAIAHLACRKLDLARFGELAGIAQKVE